MNNQDFKFEIGPHNINELWECINVAGINLEVPNYEDFNVYRILRGAQLLMERYGLEANFDLSIKHDSQEGI